MNKSKLSKAHDHMYGIDRHYQYGTHTVGPCPTVGCEDMGRGGGLCAFCHEAKLAEYAGDRLAALYHGAVIHRSDAYHAIRELLEEEETNDD
jgi:hypothetical protein